MLLTGLLLVRHNILRGMFTNLREATTSNYFASGPEKES